MISTTNVIRSYDKAVTEWLQDYNFTERVFGVGSNRAIDVRFMAIDKVFGEKKPIGSQIDVKRSLPELVVSRIGFEPDMSRNHRGIVRRWDTKVEDGDTLYKQMELPKPYLYLYQVEVKTKKLSHLNQICDVLKFDLMPQLTLDIELTEPFGTKYGAVNLRGVSFQNIPVELTESDTTELVQIFDLSVEGWIFMDRYPWAGRIEEAELEFRDLDTEEVFMTHRVTTD